MGEKEHMKNINTTQIKDLFEKHKIKIAIICFIIAALLPLVLQSSYQRGIITKITIYAIAASGLNIINGYSGQTNLGMAGFMCIGAYTAGILSTKVGVPSMLCILAGFIFAGLIGFLVSLPTLRLSGTFLTIITLGFSEVIRMIAINAEFLTEGTLGLKGVPMLTFFGLKIDAGTPYYLFALIVLALIVIGLYRIINSRIGRAWISIREDQEASRALGVEISFYKSINFIIGAMIGGLAGAIMLFYYRYTAPDNWMLEEGFNVLSMVTIGGMGTLVGPILGSIVTNSITEVFRFASQYRLVLYAILIILTMWIRPQGIAGASDSVVANSAGIKLKKRKKKKVG